jgi:hypothetical protein
MMTSMAPTGASTAVVAPSADFATNAFHDPWNFTNSSDLVFDKGPSMGLGHPKFASGMASFTITRGYVSPLWGGYKGELPSGRLGSRSVNQLNASTYTRMHLHIYVSAATAAALAWFTCAAVSSACMGSMGFSLKAGWNDVDKLIARNQNTAKGWGGTMQGIRLALTAHTPSTTVHLDDLRIYKPSSAAAFNWAAPGGSPATLWWTDSAGTISATRSQHAGPVTNAASSPSSSSRVSANVAGYGPGTYFWAVAANGAKSLVGRTASAPLPVIDSPTAAGCGDYATSHIGHPWKFTNSKRLAAHANVARVTYSKTGVLSATNAAPQRNDPHVSMPIGPSGIDGRVYHRMTIVESYDGAFNLENKPGGGAMARVMWKRSGHTSLSQTADIVTFSGKRSITFDLTGARVVEADGHADQKYAFAGTTRVTNLRYDPNEDPGARRWHLYSIRLAADCHTASSYNLTWHDSRYVAGSTVRMEARSASGHAYQLGTTTEHSGTNSHTISIKSLPSGKYTMAIVITNPSHVAATALSTGPLVRD